MYKIAIIYAGATYESALNHIRIQELLGKIKVIGIGMQDIYAEYVDGYPVTTIENILQQEWDYLLIAGQEFCTNEGIIGKYRNRSGQNFFDNGIFVANV